MNRLLLGLLALGVSTNAFAIAVDNVQVPEPGTFGLLVAGIAGVLAVRRFGRK